MRASRWTKEDFRTAAQLGALFVAFGAVIGFFRDREVLTGAVAGALLFGLVVGVGSLAESRSEMTSLKDVEKHVLDDAVELIASVGLGNPLIHSRAIPTMQGDRQTVALFLRGLLARQVILVATRLHEPKHKGSTGETASIGGYIYYAEAEGRLTTAAADAFRCKQQEIIRKLQANGIAPSELKNFRLDPARAS